MTMTRDTEVRFTKAALERFTPQVSFSPGAAERLRTRVMTVQNEPRPGRINVKYQECGETSYRTYAERDLTPTR